MVSVIFEISLLPLFLSFFLVRAAIYPILSIFFKKLHVPPHSIFFRPGRYLKILTPPGVRVRTVCLFPPAPIVPDPGPTVARVATGGGYDSGRRDRFSLPPIFTSAAAAVVHVVLTPLLRRLFHVQCSPIKTSASILPRTTTVPPPDPIYPPPRHTRRGPSTRSVPLFSLPDEMSPADAGACEMADRGVLWSRSQEGFDPRLSGTMTHMANMTTPADMYRMPVPEVYPAGSPDGYRGPPSHVAFNQPAPRQRTAIACRYCRRRKVRSDALAS